MSYGGMTENPKCHHGNDARTCPFTHTDETDPVFQLIRAIERIAALESRVTKLEERVRKAEAAVSCVPVNYGGHGF
jgi:hypothetical protein